MAPVVKPEIRMRFPAPGLHGSRFEVLGYGRVKYLSTDLRTFEFRGFDCRVFEFRAYRTTSYTRMESKDVCKKRFEGWRT